MKTENLQLTRVKKTSRFFRGLMILSIALMGLGFVVSSVMVLRASSLEINLGVGELSFSMSSGAEVEGQNGLLLNIQTDLHSTLASGSDAAPDSNSERIRVYSSVGPAHIIHLRVSHGLLQESVVAPFSAQARLVMILLLLTLFSVVLLLLWQLMRLFGCYSQGEIFTARPVRYIRNTGLVVLGFSVLPAVTGLLGHWLIESVLPEEQYVAFSISAYPLLVGLLVLLISWVMDVGRQIQEENDLTV